jgi:hypothetical protein
MHERLSKIEEKIEHEKRMTQEAQSTTKKSLAQLCEFLESYEEELAAETESKLKEQETLAVAEPALS